jgi:hypothetical protein
MHGTGPDTGWPMSAVAKLMNISTRESASGMFFATSEDEPTFFVSTTSRDSLEEAVRCALEKLYDERDHQHVAALPTNRGTQESRPWAIIPKQALDVHPC